MSIMKFSKFFFKNFSFLKNQKKIYFFKSKNNQPFRQALNAVTVGYFCSKNAIFDNVLVYKNFDIFNKEYYVLYLRNMLKGLH